MQLDWRVVTCVYSQCVSMHALRSFIAEESDFIISFLYIHSTHPLYLHLWKQAQSKILCSSSQRVLAHSCSFALLCLHCVISVIGGRGTLGKLQSRNLRESFGMVCI